MSANIVRGAFRIVLLSASAGLLSLGAAHAQDGGGYPPGAYPQSPYAYPQDGYGPAPYQPYGPAYGAYGPGGYPSYPPAYGPQGYAEAPNGAYYDPYAQRRAWRRRQAQDQYQAAYVRPPMPTSPPTASPVVAQGPADAPPPPPPPSAMAAPPVEAPAVASTAPQAAAPKLAPPQSVALAHKIVESASAYLAYMKKASAISAAFTDGAGVAKEVRTGAAYEAKQFEEGAIAYAAIVALQEPAFIDGIRNASGGNPARAQQIAADLMAHPDAAATFPGADIASARASAALRRQGDRLLEAGTKVKQSAYDVQHSAWSKTDVLNPEVRLAGAKTLSATRFTPEREETDKLLKLTLAEQGEAAYAGQGASSPLISRGLALAALAVLGQAGEGSAERLQPLMAEEKGGECLHMAKLNLFQCLAVAGPHYEDIFCLGQHAMMDTAQCVIKASGLSQPVMTARAAPAPSAAPVQVAQVSPAPQDYWVPLGGGSVSEAARK
jgi:hypothetical protein